MSKFDKAVFMYDTTEFSMFAHLTEARLKQSAVNPEAVKGLLEKFDNFRVIVEGVVAKVGEIKGSHMLSDQGKAESCVTLVRSSLKDLETARSTNYDDWVGSLVRQTDPARKTAEQHVDDAFGMRRVVDELKAQEIRATVADMDPMALAIKYKEKARLGDRRFIFAINEAPVDPLITAEVQEQGDQLLRESLFPEGAAQLRDVRLLLEALDAVYNTARQVVMRFTDGRPLEDPLAEVVAGTRSAKDLQKA